MIKSIRPSKMFSFAHDSEPVELGALNVFIGPNGSGKTNLLRCIDLIDGNKLLALRDYWPSLFFNDSQDCMMEVEFQSGFVYKFYCKKAMNPSVQKDVLQYGNEVYYESDLNHVNIYNSKHRVSLIGGQIESSQMFDRHVCRASEVLHEFTAPLFRIRNVSLEKRDIKSHIDYCVVFGWKNIRCEYIELLEKASIHVPSNLRGEEFQDWMHQNSISSGSRAYAAILASLLNSSHSGSGLLIMDNPEFGIHPDLIPTIADAIIEASKRRQIIITTHSDIMLDCFSAHYSAVTVFEKENGKTRTRKVEPSTKYSLGELWTRGGIGGNHF